MSQNIDVNILPKLDPTFMEKIQASVDKKTLQLKVELDTKSFNQLQKNLPEIKLKFNNDDLLKANQSIVNTSEATYTSLTNSIAKISDIARFNKSAYAGLQSAKLIAENIGKQAIKSSSGDPDNQDSTYQSITKNINNLNQSFSNLGTDNVSLKMIDGFLSLSNSILKVVDNVGLLGTALAGLAIYKTSKGVG